MKKIKQNITNKNKQSCEFKEIQKVVTSPWRTDVKQHAAMYRNATNAYLAESDDNQIKAHMTHMHTADRQTDWQTRRRGQAEVDSKARIQRHEIHTHDREHRVHVLLSVKLAHLLALAGINANRRKLGHAAHLLPGRGTHVERAAGVFCLPLLTQPDWVHSFLCAAAACVTTPRCSAPSPFFPHKHRRRRWARRRPLIGPKSLLLLPSLDVVIALMVATVGSLWNSMAPQHNEWCKPNIIWRNIQCRPADTSSTVSVGCYQKKKSLRKFGST